MHKRTHLLHNRSNITFLASNNQQNYSLHLDKHLLGYYTLQFICQGELEVLYDEESFFLDDRSSGWFFPASPGPRLRFHPPTPESTWWHRHLAFQGELIETWRAGGLWPLEPQLAPAGMDGGACLDEITGFANATSRWSHEQAVNGLEALLLKLAVARDAPSEGRSWLTSLLEQLSHNFAPDYCQLAQQQGCSLATLRRRFKDATGQTLHEFVIAQRIARARKLLAETDLPLRQLAAQLGYDSEFFFARQFKQVAQVTPGEYRRSRLFIPPTG
jgi:AraC-like DNA-binding protein